MSTLNDDDIFITFEELCQLDKADISLCVDKCSALSICEKSSASPSEIYNIWVQKLFKAYDLQEFSHKDWQRIIQHLSNALQEFVKNINITNDSTLKQLDQWWFDTQELLKWVETVTHSLDMLVMSLILTFALELIIKTCQFANKSNIKNLLTIQELLISLADKSLLKMPITDANEFEGFNKVLTSLCDVGYLISSADIKITIETWRSVVKLSEKFNSYCRNFQLVENATNTKNHWYDKAILGIFKEVKKILQLYYKNPAFAGDNLLQIVQFYLKILRLLIIYSKNNIKQFPATKEFFEIYSLCYHEMLKKEIPKIDLFIKKGLLDIFSLIHSENEVVDQLLLHLKYDMDNFVTCDLVLYYLKYNVEHYVKNRLNVRPDVKVLLKLYNCLFAGSLIFVDKDKYCKILESFAVLTVLDSNNELHKKLCEYVVDSRWIRAYASTEILNMYYSYICQQEKANTNLKCFEFWLNIWNNFNKSSEKFRKHKKLIEILLKTITHHITADKLQQCYSNKYENIEILLLLSGKETEQLRQYLQRNLVQNLNKLQQRQLNVTTYRELLNLLEICKLKPVLITQNLQECLLNSFTSLFSLPTKDLEKFREFFNKTLRIFYLKQDKQLNDKLLTFLNEHEQLCLTIQSVFLIEFLLKQKPQSTNLLQTLLSRHKQSTNISNLLTQTTLNKDLSIDLKIFQDLSQDPQKSSDPQMELEQIRKKPRLDKGNFSNIKFILNDLHSNTQKLLQFERSTFDASDLALMQVIRSNLDKCFNK